MPAQPRGKMAAYTSKRVTVHFFHPFNLNSHEKTFSSMPFVGSSIHPIFSYKSPGSNGSETYEI